MSGSLNTTTGQASLPSLRKSVTVFTAPGQRGRDGAASVLPIPGVGSRVSVVGSSSNHEGESRSMLGFLNALRPNRSSLTAIGPDGASASLRRVVGAGDDPLLAGLASSDLTATKAVADIYYSQTKETAAENARLRAALQQQEVDSVQVVQFLEGKLKEVETEAQAYKAGIAQLLDAHRHAEEALQTQYSDMVRERDTELTRYASVTTKLHDDLRQASRYVQQRQEHTVELQQLQKQLEDLVVAHEKEVAALHFQTVDRKLKLIALEKAMRAEFDALVEARAAAALEDRFQGVLQRTRRLEEEKASMTHDIHNLMQLTTDIDAERVLVRRQAAVQQQAHRELAQHAMARGRLKEQADLKIFELEEQVRELTARQRAVRAELEAGYQARLAAVEAELKATRTSLQTHRAELQHMRQLTARVVGERSELENFFHTALADCQRYRQGIAAAAGANAANNTATTTSRGTLLAESVDWGGLSGGTATVPAVASAAPSPSPSLAATLKDGGVFFEDLPWRDKEKVIKSLLFFLNANYYKSSSPPPPPPPAAAPIGSLP
ncbi:hypothetical protein NESM_000868500 [Novymonas esmeraldas]|uniref:Uncharacterized protein n=1 Tax=Novymonas esmeraldas TaxID=1808958 RepID=A0AAW0F1R0_9TRYP